MHEPTGPTRSSRRGFTLIELMVVIVILAVLVGLLLPAVMRAQNSASNAAVAAEIQALNQALASFQNKYGAYPPSRLVVAEDGDYSTANLGSINAGLAQRSQTWLRKFWPRIKLTNDGTKPAISGGWYDVNGDTVLNKPYVLDGRECLVLFLGGVPMRTDTGWATTGFSQDPTNPFQGSIPPSTAGAWPYSNNRSTPYMEFRPGSLKPTGNPMLPATGQFAGATDRNGGFYAYFSAYGGAGYDPNDVDVPEPDDAETVTAARGGLVSFNAPDGIRNVTGRTDIVSSAAPNPYLNDAPLPVTSAGAIDTTNKRPKQYYNANTYQIISPGRDLKYGIGGQWVKDANETLPFYPSANQSATNQALGNGVRAVEKDNITNFSGGALE